MAARLEAVGLGDGEALHIPLTQADLADACGLSKVHANRTLQELRHRGLIAWKGREVRLLQRKELERVAEFLPNYLHHRDHHRHRAEIEKADL
jgi:CRP-like cAMP-binding protein